jgi:DNA-directed RNA polymerase specialized sigma24 family protein
VTSYSVTEPIDKLAAWLFTVARNRITDWYRKKKHVSLPRDENDDLLPVNLEDVLYDPDDTPDSAYIRSIIRMSWRMHSKNCLQSSARYS